MLTPSMKHRFANQFLFALSLALTAQNALFAASEKVELKGPLPTQGAVALPANQADPNAMGGFSAPGADAIMTPDLLLVTPSNSTKEPAKPLKDLIGTALKLQIDRSDIVFDKLRGIMITVTNETNRPLVIDGEKATAIVGGKDYSCVPVSTIQQAIVPPHRTIQNFEELLTKALPAAATVGAAPTVRDIKVSRKPVLERYGPDELRRKIEYSRFGRRIVWTNQKIQGIVYFQTNDDLTGAKMSIPTTTLFDSTDAAILTVSP
jgi:hypothetical protein